MYIVKRNNFLSFIVLSIHHEAWVESISLTVFTVYSSCIVSTISLYPWYLMDRNRILEAFVHHRIRTLLFDFSTSTSEFIVIAHHLTNDIVPKKHPLKEKKQASTHICTVYYTHVHL